MADHPAFGALGNRVQEAISLVVVAFLLAVTGNVGGGGRATYTVHGDTVNLAARLEALNKEHGTSLLVSAATARELPGVRFESVGRIAIRGLNEPVEVLALPAAQP